MYRAAISCLDYGKLSRQQKAVLSGAEHRKIEADFQEQIKQRQAALAQSAPNFKASEQYEEAKASSCIHSSKHLADYLLAKGERCSGVDPNVPLH